MPSDTLSFSSLSLILGMLNQRSQNESIWYLRYYTVDENGRVGQGYSVHLCYENLVDFPLDTVRLRTLSWHSGVDTVKFSFATNTVEVRTPNYQFFTEIYPLLRNASIRTIHLTMSF